MRDLKKQKSAGASPRRNRYYAGAKMSEHKFLRLLYGYAHGVPLQALEPTTHVSGKTIRLTYRTLRVRLPVASNSERQRFARAGDYLFGDGSITAEARHAFAAVERTRRFGRYIKRHAPRLSSCEEEQAYLIEKLIRIFCALDLRGQQATPHRLAEIAEAFTQLQPGEPLQKLADLIPGARAHAHPELRLYEDYRRYLLKNPIRKSASAGMPILTLD